MQYKPRYRLAVDAALQPGASMTLTGNAAHYLAQVLRLGAGDAVALFNRTDGEWRAEIAELRKRELVLRVVEQRQPPAVPLDFHVAFAPIKGGRLETIIEKSTELGAARLQPVITQRTIVDKVNAERADTIAREAAEQCERTDWPLIDAPLKLAMFLGNFPKDRLLVYGDETGEGVAITDILSTERIRRVAEGEPRSGVQASPVGDLPKQINSWTILAGPEGGFTPEELALLRRMPNARAVSLGPRILRADTAIITLAAITLAAWGDWHRPPRFTGENA